jgi:hypothetical protein
MKGTHGEARNTNLTVFSSEDRATDVAQLRTRAESLRRTAESQHELVAQAYRRRAAELELEVWLTQLRAGHLVGPVAA